MIVTTPRPDWIVKGTYVTVRDVITGRTVKGLIADVGDTQARVKLPKGADPKHPNRTPTIPFSFSSAARYDGSLAPVGWRKNFPGDPFRAVLRIAPPAPRNTPTADVDADKLLDSHLLGLPGDTITEAVCGTPVTDEAVTREIEATLTEWAEQNDGQPIPPNPETEGIIGDEIVDADVIDEDEPGIDERLARALAPVADELRYDVSKHMQEIARRRASSTWAEERARLDLEYGNMRRAADALADLTGEDMHNVPF